MRLSLLLLALAANAQSIRVGQVYTHRFPELDIVLEISASLGSPPMLKAADITLLEDSTPAGQATNLRRFHETGQGVAVALCVDASGSMRGKPIQAVREGLGGFVGRARDYDQIAVATIADELNWETAWSTPRAELRQHLENIQARGSLTRLWDGIEESLTMLGRPDLPQRRRLVVISDGHDEGSHATLEAVIAHAAALRIPVDAVGISRSDPAYLRTLETLARSTGGTFRVATNTEELKDHIAGGIQQLLDTPVATFHAKRLTADGKIHDAGVRWSVNNQSDQMPVQLPDRPMPWFRWWHGAIGGAVLLFTLVPLFRRRKPVTRLEPPAPAPRPIVPVPIPIPAPRPIEPQPIVHKEPIRRPTQFGAAFPNPTAGRPTAYLRGLDGPAGGWRVPINQTEFWIGAEPNNHCALEIDETVSANHACIRFEGTSLRIYDNHSTNRTWVNLQPIADTAQLLSPGDHIRIGKSTFVLETES